MNQTQSLKQPAVFYLACLTSMMERFGFYTLSFVLVLYLKDAYHLTDTMAFGLFAIFNALVYVTPAIGGYLADNYLGIRRAIILGLILEALGLTLLAIPQNSSLTIPLSLMILGIGFFKTSPTNLMARSYSDNDPRIDSGFTWYYMIMNFGSFIAPISAGIIQLFYGWHMAFASGAIVVWATLFIYFFLRKNAEKVDSSAGKAPLKIKGWIFIAIGIILSSLAGVLLVQHAILADSFFIFASIAIVLYFLFEIFKSPKEEKLKIIACLILILMGMAFFLLYFQIFTSITLYIERVISHRLLGMFIPTPVYLSLNAFWVITLSPILATTYLYLNKRHRDLPVTIKFSLGLLFTSLSFFILAISTSFAAGDSQNVSSLWYLFSMLSLSLGELLISALGVAMVTRIAPERMYGIMMGAWYLIACAMASSLSGALAASLTSVPKIMINNQTALLHIYHSGFMKMGFIGVGTTILAFIIGPYVKRIANL